jgi:large subunit ribosomal protein L31
MKTDIHPKYYDCQVTCGCGNSWKTRSTMKEMRIEICSKCHPFYSGVQKYVDAAGRVDRFNKKYGKPAQTKA